MTDIITDPDMMTAITICMGSSCFARGNGENLRVIEDYIAEHDLAAQVDLRGCRCQGECSRGPCIDIGGESFVRVDSGTLNDLLAIHLPDSGSKGKGDYDG